jgi:hypothetical protein
MSGIKQFESRLLPKRQDDSSALLTLPCVDDGKSKAIVVELDRLVERFDGEDDPHLVKRHQLPLSSGCSHVFESQSITDILLRVPATSCPQAMRMAMA